MLSAEVIHRARHHQTFAAALNALIMPESRAPQPRDPFMGTETFGLAEARQRSMANIEL